VLKTESLAFGYAFFMADISPAVPVMAAMPYIA